MKEIQYNMAELAMPILLGRQPQSEYQIDVEPYKLAGFSLYLSSHVRI